MTTSQDEIAVLRGYLEHIREFIRHERKYGDLTDANSSGNILRDIEMIVKVALKTPRASRIMPFRDNEIPLEDMTLPPPQP